MTFVIYRDRIISFDEDIKALKPKQLIAVRRLFWNGYNVPFNMQYDKFNGYLGIITADSADDMLAVLEKKIREDFQKWLASLDEKAAACFYITTNKTNTSIFQSYFGTTEYINKILQVLEKDFKSYYSIIFNKLFSENSLEEIYCEFYDKIVINVNLFKKYYGNMIIMGDSIIEYDLRLDVIGISGIAEKFVITDNLLRELNFDKWKESFSSKCKSIKEKYEEMKSVYSELPLDVRLILELENKGFDD